MEIKIKGDHQFDQCGDNYLEQEYIDISFSDDYCAKGYILMNVGELKNIFIEKKELKKVLMLLGD